MTTGQNRAREKKMLLDVEEDPVTKVAIEVDVPLLLTANAVKKNAPNNNSKSTKSALK